MEIASSKAEVAEGDINDHERVSCQSCTSFLARPLAMTQAPLHNAHCHTDSLDVQLLAEITEATRIALEEDPDYAR